ncbi:PadR family transcriptional regulator [Deinococcus aerophilus]|uniref:PadR family transcriptional regulator n=1 Tax=Deinococcus aerophilus TaxID=522488 RepID=A0ABQ2GZQ3_9DEIO|nr:PadR family transcriptional regulator [Deinococcus aerophilus]GGM21922.1 PadR family transcriptional regulator [Deinococcus aerophilus]
MEDLRITTNLLRVFRVLLDDLDAQHYALDLSKSAKVNVGTIYALVARLQRAGLLRSDLEDVDPVVAGRPPRRYYRLTGEGIRYAEQTLREHRADIGLSGGVHV